jgi:hypothetical protein
MESLASLDKVDVSQAARRKAYIEKLKRAAYSSQVGGRCALCAGRWALGAGRWALGAGRWALQLQLQPPCHC